MLWILGGRLLCTEPFMVLEKSNKKSIVTKARNGIIEFFEKKVKSTR